MPSIRSLILAFLVLLLTIFTTTTTAYTAKFWTNDNCTGDFDYEIDWASDDTCRNLECAGDFELAEIDWPDLDYFDDPCPSRNFSRPIYSIEYESDIGCMLSLFSDNYCHENYTVTNHEFKCISPGYRIWGMSCGN